MKKYLLPLLLICCCTNALAQEAANSLRNQRIETREARHALGHRENNLFFTIATGWESHNILLATYKLEYSRQIKHNFYWGVAFSTNFGLGNLLTYDAVEGSNPYRNTVQQDIYKLDGMVYYRAPIIRNRLFFRIGVGIGAGYHQIEPTEELRDKILPYCNFEAAWILRCSRNFELKFAPTLILTPSQIAFSPLKLDKPTNVTPILLDAGFSLTMGWRF